MSITVTPTTPHFVAEISGLDLAQPLKPADRDAIEAAIDRYAAQGVGRDLAARVYTSRLLGRDPRLVLHGGGNTSVKTTMRDLLGEEVAVLCVKGSGADMAVIEPAVS